MNATPVRSLTVSPSKTKPLMVLPLDSTKPAKAVEAGPISLDKPSQEAGREKINA
jgi:hypothetical protein